MKIPTTTQQTGFEALVKGQALYPQEQLLALGQSKQRLDIGIPKEHARLENRLPLTPDAVRLLIDNGHQVTVEAGAGVRSRFEDREYSEAGAKIAYDAKEVLACELVLTVSPPSLEEVGHMKPGHTLFSALQTGRSDPDFVRALNTKRITALGYEFLEDQVGGLPIMRAMSEIAGSTVMLIAAEYLSSLNHGRGVIVGGITGVPPTKVVILGAGTVSELAARTAIGLGAEVKIFDNHVYKLRRIKQGLGQQIFTATIHGGTLPDAVTRADVVIAAVRAEEGRAPLILTEETV
ncbi:MAG: alanine dehydrogenase, partial [Catalinimonas sp.]